MERWRIEDTLEGMVLGTYDGATDEAALDAHAIHAGYARHADLVAARSMRNRAITATAVSSFTYSIYDADPSAAGLAAWPSHHDLALVAEDDVSAVTLAREALSRAAGGLYRDDGYQAGQKLYAQVDDENGRIVGIVSYELTVSDLL